MNELLLIYKTIVNSETLFSYFQKISIYFPNILLLITDLKEQKNKLNRRNVICNTKGCINKFTFEIYLPHKLTLLTKLINKKISESQCILSNKDLNYVFKFENISFNLN